MGGVSEGASDRRSAAQRTEIRRAPKAHDVRCLGRAAARAASDLCAAVAGGGTPETRGVIYRVLADLVLLVHLAFVGFVVLGGLLALRWPAVMALHIPAAVWGVLIEFTGWVCPLTPLENSLRVRGGELGYSGGFIQHYIQPLLYPSGLTRGTQIVLGTFVLLLNLTAYSFVLSRSRNRVAH